MEIEKLKRQLEQSGEEHDRVEMDHSKRMLNITRETGEFLSLMIRSTKAKEVLEIGTSNGYSTLWLAEATRRTEGHVTTLERSEKKLALAVENVAAAKLESLIDLIGGDAGHFLEIAEAETYDLIFLDSDRSSYVGWWKHLKSCLRPGGLIVVDNAISHAHEMEEFQQLLRDDSELSTSLVPIGKGELLILKD